MRKFIRNHFLPILLIICIPVAATAQCANDNILTAGDLTPPGVFLSTTQNYTTGSYVLATVIAGANYTVSTCNGNPSFDSQISVYNDLTGTYIAYNDDYCGVLSTCSFTATFCGQVRVLLDQYYCSSTGYPLNVQMTQNSAGAGVPTLTSTPDMQACNGGTVTIGTANNGTGGLLPYTYSWLPTTNLATPAQPSSTATVTTTQNYTLTLTDANGCFAHDTVLVTTLPNPTVNLGNDTSFCGSSLTLNAGNFGSTYLWSTGAYTQQITATQSGVYSVTIVTPLGCTGSDAITLGIHPFPTCSIGADTSTCNPSVTLSAGPGFSTYAWTTGATTQSAVISSTGTVAVAVTDAFGCSASDTAVVTIYTTPVVNLGPDVIQCGGNVSLNAGNPGSLYFWSNNTSAQINTVSASGTYSVQVISPGGCTSSDAVNITINNQPTVNLGPDTAVCGSTIVLDAANPGCTYLWSTLATTQTETVASGHYFVHVTNSAGCTASDTIIVSTISAPTVSAGANVNICTGQNTTLTATGALTYVWSTGATTPSITVSPTTNTTYYVTGYNASGCSSSDVVTVNVLPLSNAQFTETVIGATGVFTNQSTNAVTYSWNFGDASPANNTANPSHVYSINGTYTVTLTVTGPCGSDTYTMVITISQVGLQDNDLSSTLSLFPNPNDGNFTLSFDFTKTKDVTIQVLDVSGRIVFVDQENNVMSYNKQIGLDNAESGMYFVRIMTTEGVVIQKVMIQR